jgi:hypothetical protein
MEEWWEKEEDGWGPIRLGPVVDPAGSTRGWLGNGRGQTDLIVLCEDPLARGTLPLGTAPRVGARVTLQVPSAPAL